MSEFSPNQLHLPDLQIVNFKCINSLSIGKLGRVTLIAGRNGTGKTTILEAVRIYANRGRYDSLMELLHEREEFVTSLTKEQEIISIPDYDAFFFGRHSKVGDYFSIGTHLEQDTLCIKIIDSHDLPNALPELFDDVGYENTFKALRVNYQGASYVLPWPSKMMDPSTVRSSHHISPSQWRHIASNMSNLPQSMNIVSLGPGLPKNEMLARYWDKIALTQEEPIVLDMLRLTGECIERIAVVGDERGGNRTGNKIVVKLQNHHQRVSLRSLGDGLTRLFSAGLALTSSRNGFLIIDEVENGVHYSVQYDFWKMILHVAQEYNIQVFATTHSFDCVKAFARATNEHQDTAGVLVRLSRKTGKLRAVEYSKEEILIASEQDIEVR